MARILILRKRRGKVTSIVDNRKYSHGSAADKVEIEERSCQIEGVEPPVEQQDCVDTETVRTSEKTDRTNSGSFQGQKDLGTGNEDANNNDINLVTTKSIGLKTKRRPKGKGKSAKERMREYRLRNRNDPAKVLMQKEKDHKRYLKQVESGMKKELVI